MDDSFRHLAGDLMWLSRKRLAEAVQGVKMLLNEFQGCGIVVPSERTDHAAMFRLDNFRLADAHLQGKHRDPCEIGFKTVENLNKHRVSCRSNNRLMKTPVQFRTNKQIGRGFRLMLIANGIQFRWNRKRLSANGRRGMTFDHQTHIIDIPQFGGGQGLHKSAPSGVQLQKALGGQPVQSLADGRARHSGHFANKRLFDELTGFEIPAQNAVSNSLIGTFSGGHYTAWSDMLLHFSSSANGRQISVGCNLMHCLRDTTRFLCILDVHAKGAALQ
jgi:hypothetical protein